MSISNRPILIVSISTYFYFDPCLYRPGFPLPKVNPGSQTKGIGYNIRSMFEERLLVKVEISQYRHYQYRHIPYRYIESSK